MVNFKGFICEHEVFFRRVNAAKAINTSILRALELSRSKNVSSSPAPLYT
eukprot:UN09131